MKKHDPSAPSDPAYAAFVSYRHAEVDTAVARDVQRRLERFRVPRAAREASGMARIAPVFRDKEELPVSSALGDDIAHALARSGALVVVCSPRTRGSAWVAREVDEFVRAHGRSRVFTVLAEGEPADVIPERLLFEGEGEGRRELEPLSCDFRSPRRPDRRAEATRLAAAILGVSYDSLARRARRRRARVACAVAAAAFVALSAVAAFALWSNARIQESYDLAMVRQSRLLATEAQRKVDAGDRLAAIELATAAMPDDEAAPVAPGLVNVLRSTTRAYEQVDDLPYPGSMGLVAKYALGGKVRSATVSRNERYVAALGEGKRLRAWDASTAELLLEADVPGNVAADVVLTDGGRLVVARDDEVMCWDVQSHGQVWRISSEQREEGHVGQVEQLVLSEDGSSLVALGMKRAVRIDVATGTVLKSVPYGLPDEVYPRSVAYHHAGDVPYDMRGERCAFALTFNSDGGSENNDAVCVVDFETGTARVFDNRYGWIHSVRLLGGDLLVSHSEGDRYGSDESILHTNGFVGQKRYARTVERVDATGGEARWKASVDMSSPSVCDSLLELGDIDAPFLPDDGDKAAIAYFAANVCEVLDPATGKSLARFEAPEPFVAAWPNARDSLVDGFRGCLAGGRSVAVFFSDGICSSHASECVDAATGLRMGSHTYLVGDDGVVYRYADKLEDDAYLRVTDTSSSAVMGTADGYMVVLAPHSLQTANGVVVVEHKIDASDLALTMVDASAGRVSWQATVPGREDDRPQVLGYSEAANEMYLRVLDEGSYSNGTVFTVRLDTGEVDEWRATSHGQEWDDETPFVDSHDPYGAYRGGYCAVVARKDDTFELVVTDMHARLTESVSLGDLSREVDESFYQESAIAFPHGGRFLVPVRVLWDEEGSSSFEHDGRRYTAREWAVYDPGDGTHKLLTEPIADDVAVAWSDDGEAFATCSTDSIVAYNADGAELLKEPLEGREVLSLHFEGDRLLAVCNEQESTVLVSYEVGKQGAMRMATLREGTSSGGIDVFNGVQWIPAAIGRDPNRDPGDLCVLLPDRRQLFLVDSVSAEVCQRVDGCLGYDAAAGCFVVRGFEDAKAPIRLFARYTADDFVQRGAEQVGSSVMTARERTEYGLSFASTDSE